MKQVSLLLSLLINSSSSFAPKPTFLPHCTTPTNRVLLRAVEVEAPSDVELSVQKSSSSSSSQLAVDPTTLRNELLYTANTLTEESPTGIFLTTPIAMDKFTKAASRLEAITPSMTQREKELLVGDWVLLATSRSLKSTNVKVPPEMKKLPFKFKAPKLSDSLRNSITVLQRIRSDSDESSEIDRIDHVIQYTPLSLSDFIPENSPLGAIRNWNVNPLEVSESKITLVHNANVESVEPTLRTKLGLKSVVVSVAGKSQYLEANGADILGLNVPSLGDFANGGSFDSTYVDENVRISRGTIGFLDEVRLFVRKGFNMEDIMESSYEAVMLTDEVEEKTEVEARFEKIGDAVANVVDAVEEFDKDVRGAVEKDIESVSKAVDGVRGTIAESVKDVQSVVEGDAKKVAKAVEDVRAAVVGQDAEEVENISSVVDAETVMVAVDSSDESADEAGIETDSGNDDDIPSDVNEM